MKLMIIHDGIEEQGEATHYLANLYQSILKELEVEVKMVQLDKKVPAIQAFNMALEDIDGMILISTCRWIGISSLMQSFLEECHNFHSRLFKGIPGLIITLAHQNNEYMAENIMLQSWLSLGGEMPDRLCGVLGHQSDIEENDNTIIALEKKCEDFYRQIRSKRPTLTSSLSPEMKPVIPVEQRDEVSSDLDINIPPHNESAPTIEVNASHNMKAKEPEVQVPKDQQDIFEITKLFKNKLKSVDNSLEPKDIEERLHKQYQPHSSISNPLMFHFKITGIKDSQLLIILKPTGCQVMDGLGMEHHISITLEEKSFTQLLDGKITLQNAFVLGKAKIKGQMGLLSIFDDSFRK